MKIVEDDSTHPRDSIAFQHFKVTYAEVVEELRDLEGYALVVFKRGDEDGSIETKTMWCVNDPMDIFRLPHLASVKVLSKIMTNPQSE